MEEDEAPRLLEGFPESSVGKDLACNAGDIGDMGWVPGS